MHSRTVLRPLALAVALLATLPALAAPPRDSSAAADCLQQATLQFSIDDSGCFAYPVGTVIFNECRVRAAQTYANAMVRCSQESTSATVRHAEVFGVEPTEVAPEEATGKPRLPRAGRRLQVSD